MRTRILILAVAAALAGAGAAVAQVTGAEVVKAFDKNGDGTVSKSEWVASGRPADRFDPIDANHDGKLTAEEIDQALARIRASRGAPPPAAQPAPQSPAQSPPQSPPQNSPQAPAQPAPRTPPATATPPAPAQPATPPR